ncbi:MAG: hypothetical protein H6Q15_698 [Bacteroidetes bacterium]|nr:hypothetical protein [Bacteroidota bacterium]
MKKRYIVLLIFICLIAFIVCYYCISFVRDNNKKYYIKQTGTYFKVYKPLFSDYGYIIWSKDSNLSFSNSFDFIKIKKSETSWVSFVINPSKENEMCIVDRTDNIVEINKVKYRLKKISAEDSNFFNEDIVSGQHTYLLKQPYIDITFEGYLQSVFFSDGGNVSD